MMLALEVNNHACQQAYDSNREVNRAEYRVQADINSAADKKQPGNQVDIRETFVNGGRQPHIAICLNFGQRRLTVFNSVSQSVLEVT